MSELQTDEAETEWRRRRGRAYAMRERCPLLDGYAERQAWGDWQRLTAAEKAQVRAGDANAPHPEAGIAGWKAGSG